MVFGVVALVVFVAPTALGKGPLSAEAHAEEPPVTRARDLFREGAAKFRAGEFRPALDLFEKAYALDPHPTLIYNIARAHEGLGELDEAIDAYERYLASDPNASDRGAVEQRVVTIRKQIQERNELVRRGRELDEARAREAKRTSAPAAPARSASATPWIVAGIGVVGAATGGVLLGVARSTHADAESEPGASRALELESDAKTLNTAGVITLSASLVIAVAAVTLGIIDVTSLRKSGTVAAVAF